MTIRNLYETYKTYKILVFPYMSLYVLIFHYIFLFFSTAHIRPFKELYKAMYIPPSLPPVAPARGGYKASCSTWLLLSHFLWNLNEPQMVCSFTTTHPQAFAKSSANCIILRFPCIRVPCVCVLAESKGEAFAQSYGQYIRESPCSCVGVW